MSLTSAVTQQCSRSRCVSLQGISDCLFPRRTCHYPSHLRFSPWGLAFVLTYSGRKRDSHHRIVSSCPVLFLAKVGHCTEPPSSHNPAATAWLSLTFTLSYLLKFGFVIHFLWPITKLTKGGVTNTSAGWNIVQRL